MFPPGYSTTTQRSSDVTIHSTTRKQNLTINYKVCLNWKPYHIKATAQPKYNTGYEKFNVTVVQINFYNAVLELERIDQDSGWGEMLFTVQWAIYHVSDYITSTATVQYRVDYDTDVKISGTSNVSAVYGEGLSPLPALQNNSLFQPRLSQERQNGHRFLVFDKNFNNLITSLDLNPKDGENDLVTVFIVYRRDILISNSPTSNGLFGADDNDWDKLILLTSDKLYVAGTVNINIAISSFPTNANPIAFNIWNVISVQWNLNGGVDASSVWCNGKLLQR
uniref:Uncharacterized protein n=1 Tax=Ciona intestinalis TaxID=7719 RepID=H2XUS1_CIOIN